MTPRPLDHLVLPTADLAVARGRLERLGFTVAPEGRHPFGTANACVYFANGGFMEPLAVADREAAETAVADANSFVLGDARFRRARGEEGVSAIVFGTDDAVADHAAFSSLGLAGGSMVEFSRPALDMDGKADIASFRLAFCADPQAPDLFFFTCQRLRAPRIDRGALERHANGATRIVRVTAAAEDPAAFAGFLAAISRSTARAGPQGTFEVALANAGLEVGAAQATDFGVTLAGVVFAVPDLAVTERLLSANGIGCRADAGALRVPAAAGQGADFIFEETS